MVNEAPYKLTQLRFYVTLNHSSGTQAYYNTKQTKKTTARFGRL